MAAFMVVVFLVGAAVALLAGRWVKMCENMAKARIAREEAQEQARLDYEAEMKTPKMPKKRRAK
tara:strand:- start:1146 stop:1337 length:192 start_codon:yes stop_codon:yes gene_type:complete